VDTGGALLLRLKGPPHQAPPAAIPWFLHPGRRTAGQRIAFGHWSTLGLNQQAGTLCLDGGCVWGGSLCAARLDRDEPPVIQGCAGHLVPGAD
jgi:bis(5'-nucleosyl)-tetraphosphatase (symmetrical)